PENDSNDPVDELDGRSLPELSVAMMKAAEKEDYEEAARIKAEIDNRKENNDKS
ncbi:MAG: UvrB/UvrC motif-containing protein, partial [Muribaculaceae bacterium]|nr:UvrB/UvrC motif-containing protein [Muribaculaceae bacterium]